MTTTALDLDFVRAQFPAFGEPSLRDQAFFENAGGSYACRQVIARLGEYYTRLKLQPYCAYAASSEAGRWMDAAHYAAHHAVAERRWRPRVVAARAHAVAVAPAVGLASRRSAPPLFANGLQPEPAVVAARLAAPVATAARRRRRRCAGRRLSAAGAGAGPRRAVAPALARRGSPPWPPQYAGFGSWGHF